jgi:Concanavalin A-like lectin/glucanases superfamily
MIANRTLSTIVLGFLAAGCSSDDSGSAGGGAGIGGPGGSSVAAGVGGTGTGGAATGGSGGGSAGTTTPDGGGGNAGIGGGASGANDDGGKEASKNAGDGSTSCLGRAVSFNANTGQGNDAAKARVEIDFGASTDLPTGNAQRTIEFWAYVLTSSWSGDTNTMFFYGTNNRVADGFGLDFGGVKGTIDPFTNAIFDNDDQPTGLDATKDQWAHFAMTWDSTAVRAFVNGVEKATKTSSVAQKTLMTGRTPFILGAYPSNYFNGSIDELRIWNVARSAVDITSTMKKTLVGNEAGLVGYWKLDETSGTTAADSVTTVGHVAHPGTLMAASAAQLPTWVPGAPVSCP